MGNCAEAAREAMRQASLQHAVAELHDECRRLQEEGALYPGLSIRSPSPPPHPAAFWVDVAPNVAAYAEHGIDRFAVVMLDPDDPHVRRGALGEGHGARIVPTRYAGPGHGGASCNVAAPHPLLPGGSACALPSPDPRAVVAHVNSLAWLVTF